jgi:hypothetical protein
MRVVSVSSSRDRCLRQSRRDQTDCLAVCASRYSLFGILSDCLSRVLRHDLLMFALVISG